MMSVTGGIPYYRDLTVFEKKINSGRNTVGHGRRHGKCLRRVFRNFGFAVGTVTLTFRVQF
jgi:hypothetical protein